MSARLDVVVIRDAEGLAEHVAALDGLVSSVSEPNPFYEPWMLLPALRTQPHGDLRLVLVWGPDLVGDPAIRVLYGFFPLEEPRRLYHLPVRHYTTWKHNHCYLCTPLLRKGAERETWTAFFEWLDADDRRPAVAQFKHIAGDGAVYQALVDVMNQRRRLYCVWEVFNRALFRPRENAERYLAEALSGVHRKEFRRQWRSLCAHGEVSFQSAVSTDDLLRAQREFLEIEASGWKGRRGTALGSTPADRTFFEDATREGFARGQVSFLTLRVGDRPVAVKCNLRSGEGAFAFKIGFDEQFSKLSPGAHLEMENIRVLHEQPQIRWMDSCANPVHFMINRLWLDRRLIQTVVVSTGGVSGDILVTALPSLKLVKARIVDGRNGPSQ